MLGEVLGQLVAGEVVVGHDPVDDGGLDAARPFLRRVFAPLVEEGRGPQAPAKSRLQEWLQGRGFDLPRYRITSTSGPAHQPVFEVTVAAAGREAEGRGDTRRAAEQAAAEAWLEEVERR